MTFYDIYNLISPIFEKNGNPCDFPYGVSSFIELCPDCPFLKLLTEKTSQ